ncbi:MASE1 domain-containing protein [Oculatella sp. LEGE 06141]|uniref:sensor histidine kinase n=1 Tax=Oculatella sp. LEGE 06141 TaxID=1828648 RepID=UPI0018820550|nr:MASE1 domain-containing protein [Oculatella sp. LEGE 06141]MBE9181379.1 MASE1 domain-containing protein [Oculatella sp. LEGE 06141]
MSHSRIRSWHYLVIVGAIAVAYMVSAQVAFSVLELSVEASPVWPPAGIALAAVLLFGRRTWAGVAIGALWFNLSLGVSLLAASGSALGATLQALAGATLLHQIGFQRSLGRLHDALGFIVFGSMATAFVNATISTGSGLVLGYVDRAEVWRNWSIVWLGDSTGILVITPLLLTIGHWFYQRWPVQRRVEAGLWLALLSSASWFIFCSSTNTAIADYPLEYLPFPLLIWGALRFGQSGASLASFIISGFAICGAVRDHGPFVRAATGEQAIVLMQAFMSVVTITGLVLATAVAEQQRTEDLLRRSEASLANAQQIARLGNWDFDFVQQQWSWSDELYRLLGFEPHSVLPGQDVFLQVVHPSDREHVRQAMDSALQHRKPYTIDYRIVLPDGSERIVGEQVAIWATGITGTVQDITAQKQAEAALSDSQEKFSKAFCSSPDSITISTLADGRYLDVNETFLQTTGYERDQVIGRTSQELKVWASYVDRTQLTQLVQHGGVHNQEFEFCRKSGELGVALVSAEIIQLGGEPCLLCVTRDITERKRVEERMRLTAERDRLLGEIALRIRRSLNLDDILNTAVAEVRQFLRADRVFISRYDENGIGEVIAESVAAGFTPALGWTTDAETYQEVESAFQRDRLCVVHDTSQVQRTPFLDEYYTRFEIKAGIGVPIVLNHRFFGVMVANQCSDARYWHPLEIDLLEQLATQMAIAIQQGQLYQQVQTLNANLEQQVFDRTEQLQQKMQELQELNQLKEVFLHAVCHDLRTTVMGTLLVLRNLHSQPGETVLICRSMLERMIHCGEFQLSKLNSLLEAYVSKTQGIILEPERVPLTALVHDVVTELEPLLTQNRTQLINQLTAGLPPVLADVVQLRRVFNHLLTNAIKHNPPGVEITLTATVEANLLRCTVSDNGVGISDEKCKHLFELRLGSPQERQLTGISLGLYLCQQIIRAHGGEIDVKSQPGVGSSFWFTMPLAPGL